LAIKKSLPPIIELESTDSTNNYAMGLIHAGLAQHGTTVLAAHQTAGKGQRGKNWESPAGESLNFSIVICPLFLNPSNSFQLLATIAVAVQKRIELYTGDETKIKWPNDLYWRDRKAGGILIESVIKGNNWKWAVIGIGINCNQGSFPSFLPNPVSLKQITGKNISILQLAKELQTDLMNTVSNLEKNGFANFFKAYNQKLYKQNLPVKLKHQNRSFETIVKRVNEAGELIAGNSEEWQFRFGEVEWVIEF
jgi:BirA family transcriptional regulator, biotin operon repressor / biotin---[acetyl-CoA-carboxylase] ligase